MSETGQTRTVSGWSVHHVASMGTAFLAVIAGIGAVLAVGQTYGQVTDHEKRIGQTESGLHSLDNRVTAQETTSADISMRLNRIEDKLDKDLSLRAGAH